MTGRIGALLDGLFRIDDGVGPGFAGDDVAVQPDHRGYGVPFEPPERQ
jgi:hypothetical protein